MVVGGGSGAGVRHARAEGVEVESGGLLGGKVGQHDDEDAAAGAGVDDGGEPGDGVLGEIGREVGDDEVAVGLGDLAGDAVVLVDGGVVVAEVLLDDVFDVLGEFGEALLDVAALGPDAGADEGVVVIGEAHEPGEGAAAADGINDGELGPARRDRREEAEEDGLEEGEAGVALSGRGLDQERLPVDHVEHDGEVECVGERAVVPRVECELGEQ
ncbi:MAG: hypothetical protein HND58_11955 [Planctomycetota bacterium]|nr:MAG: hypothetical protein HND58_11955 [Planctomycetota bacterium]